MSLPDEIISLILSYISDKDKLKKFPYFSKRIQFIIKKKCKKLELRACNITDEGLKSLSTLTNLQFLYLDYCDNITDDGIKFLLNLINCKIIK